MSSLAEEIPKEASLFKYFPRSKYDAAGRPNATAYLALRGGMSTSWDKYCTAEECRSGLDKPHTFGVVSLHVECIKGEPPAIAVRHTPKDWPNLPTLALAHTDVLVDNDDLEQQLKLYVLAVPVLAPDPPKLCESEEKRLKKAAPKGT